MTNFIEQAMQTARQAAAQGSQKAMQYYGSGVAATWKEDHSPVTVADQQAEVAIMSVIRSQFPHHCVLAEESGFTEGDRECQWHIDPIDGTRGFIRGGKFWGSLVALEYQGAIVAGAMTLPALGLEYWAGRGLGCFRNGVPMQVSKQDQWKDATLSVGELQHLLRGPHQAGVLHLIQNAGSTRCYGDPGGLMMVLEGLADVWIEAGVKTWDLAPARILVEEAGGRFTNFPGSTTLTEGTAIASNGLLHAEVLARLQVHGARIVS